MSASSPPLLRVQNLQVVYHSVVRALRGITLEVPSQGVVALLGPNGAGKSTALRAISGLLDLHDGAITQGRVELNGQSLLPLAADSRVRAGVVQVLEGRRILDALSVEENLLAGGFGMGPQARKELVESAFTRFPLLRERRAQPAGYLSGGEQQLLAICRGLMRRPRVLLLDEPFLGLSPKAVGEVSELIRRISEEGVSVLLVEQNAKVALGLASHGYVLETGKVVLDGPAEKLREDPDVQEFYLGFGREGQRGYHELKRYRRKRRWLS
ncbi:ABC transporter ATP-binding protein [Myxococcus stipitatus]|uniref:ABC transporter ATP-binding protein n=1 Tax=Myxococcus stipitatus TaxID=83455 RepID=UPI001F271A61|nr:ABC transporter ATP-binding protein [Myxococcus stipitatus]MCE9668919.1 ABC transporter ATP-binding protein [Myxococcus stipitatus]